MNKIKYKLLGMYLIIISTVLSGCQSDNVDESVTPSDNVLLVQELDGEVVEQAEDFELIDKDEIIQVADVEGTVPSLNTVTKFADNAPELTAVGAIAIEPSTGTVFYEKNMHEKLYPASMTKILTALVAMDYFDIAELIEIGSEINEIPWDSSKAGHIVGETITMENLLRGLLVYSGNDSANVIASIVAERVMNDDSLSLEEWEEIFANLLNEKARSLGAINSNFVRGHGYHDDEHYTTPYDMALIAIEFLKNDILMRIVGETSFNGDGANGMFEGNENVKTKTYSWRNHNLFITDNEHYYEYATGLKTGFTTPAGPCVIASAKNDEGEEIIVAIFNSPNPDRWIDGRALFDYSYDDYKKIDFTRKNQAHTTMNLSKHNPLNQSEVDLIYEDDSSIYMPTDFNEEEVTTKVYYYNDYSNLNEDGVLSLVAPLTQGDAVGVVEFFVGEKKVASVNLLVKDDIEIATARNKAQYLYERALEKMFSLEFMIIAGICVFLIVSIVLQIRKNRSRRKIRYTTNTNYTFKNKPKPNRNKKGNKKR